MFLLPITSYISNFPSSLHSHASTLLNAYNSNMQNKSTEKELTCRYNIFLLQSNTMLYHIIYLFFIHFSFLGFIRKTILIDIFILKFCVKLNKNPKFKTYISKTNVLLLPNKLLKFRDYLIFI